MSDSHDASTAAAGSAGSTAPGDDPLKGLYRMSTTAGVGSQEYVAINPLAVTAIVLGLLSVTVLLGWPLLIVPIAAIVFAVVALGQIRNSSGTQSGRSLAWGGIVLGVAFAALIGTRQVMARMTAAEEQREIAALAEQLGQQLQARDWKAAYALFSPEFQQAWPPQQFIERAEQVLVTERLGSLNSITAGSRVHLEDYAGGRRAYGIVYFNFEKLPEPAQQSVEYRNTAGEWRIFDIPQLFQPPTAGQ